jgi:large subunit ribosomal protein L4
LVKHLSEYGVENVLIVSAEVDENLYLAARNLHAVDVLDVEGVDPLSLIGHDKVMITVDAVKKFEEMLG